MKYNTAFSTMNTTTYALIGIVLFLILIVVSSTRTRTGCMREGVCGGKDTGCCCGGNETMCSREGLTNGRESARFSSSSLSKVLSGF